MLIRQIWNGHFAKVSHVLRKLLNEVVDELWRDKWAIYEFTLSLRAQIHDCRLYNFDSDSNEAWNI